MSTQTSSIRGNVHAETGANISIGNNISYNISLEEWSSAKMTSPNKEVKSAFYNVPHENKAFVERPDIFKKMEDALFAGPSGGCKIAALSGLGGMGKTQLMLRFSYLHRTKYDFVFWLNVDSWSMAADSFRSLALYLGIPERILEEKSEDKSIEWVRNWLETRSKWLLLLDNLDDRIADQIFQILPREGGHIILTTRGPIPSKCATIINVGNMKENEALSALLGEEMHSIDREGTRFHNAYQIVLQFEFMPLAIELARAYIENTASSFQSYLDQLKRNQERLLSYKSEDSLGDYEHTVATVWNISFDRVREFSATVPILETCTFLHPDEIPTRLFERQFVALDLCSMAQSSLDKPLGCEDVQTAIAVLNKFSLVTITVNEGDSNNEIACNTLRMHRLVREVVYATIEEDRKINWARKLTEALNIETENLNTYDTKDRSVMQMYLPHICHFVELLENLNEKVTLCKDLVKLLNNTVLYLRKNGVYNSTEKLAEISVVISGNIYGPEHPDMASSVNNLAILYRNQGKHEQAEPLQGKYEQAEQLYQRALAIREKALGPVHPYTATSVNDLAKLYGIQGKYKQAKPLFQRALEIREKVLGPEHSDTIESRNALNHSLCIIS
ncbi:uncharacterized protein VTP21DRAFT_1062 [Calcarisporiella thermophila]|uniref:uncharacterized protein n=1 Tax=Calcarisporiella thermophila TaxID=911321 RepID=UPI00374205FA